ncbi:MAG TPA: hypothetical protein VIG99_31590 [Myxococcaceae bacterium]
MRSRITSLVLIAVALAALSCAGKRVKRVSIDSSIQPQAVLVYPFGFRWDEPAWRSYGLGQRLVAAAQGAVGERALLFGPGEFKIYRAEDNNAWAATTAATLLPAYHLKPEQVVLLRPWAEKRVLTSRQDVSDSRGRKLGAQAVEETTYVVHVEIVHPSTQAALVDLSEEVTPDPFAQRADDEPDPAPELTALAGRLADEALHELDGQWRSYGRPRWREVPLRKGETVVKLTARANPAVLYTFGDAARPSLEIALAKANELERELLQVAQIRFLNPGLSDADATRLSRLPPGLQIATAPAKLNLKPGQLIVEVQGQPAAPQMLERARLWPEPVPIKIRDPDGTYHAGSL